IEQKRRGERDSTSGMNSAVPDYIREADAAAATSTFARDAGDGPLERAYRENPLATDIRYWGNWMLERAREELAQFYPPDPDGSVPAAYLWSRTIVCPNCGADMPLIRQYWLSRGGRQDAALVPVVEPGSAIRFDVRWGKDVGEPL